MSTRYSPYQIYSVLVDTCVDLLLGEDLHRTAYALQKLFVKHTQNWVSILGK